MYADGAFTAVEYPDGTVKIHLRQRVRLHLRDALHGGIEIVGLEPDQHPIAIRLVRDIADGAVMVFYLEAVQLKDKLAVRDQPLIL